jgi:hypothetical protein
MDMIRTIKTSKNLALIIVLFTAMSCNTPVKKKKTLALETATESSISSKKEIVETKTGAYLQITLKVSVENRPAAAGVYLKYKAPFLNEIDGAISKKLIKRTEDVQVLHGFETKAQADTYLMTDLFSKDIVGELGPLLVADPEVRIYSVFEQ